MSDELTTFGEKLLGLQGFNAERAQRYRAEMEKLLAHRITRNERWGLAICGTYLGIALMVSGILIASAKSHPEFEGLDAARWTVAAACVLTGLLLAGWMLRVAISGGYARRLGDIIGLVIATIFCGGWCAAFVQVGWSTDNTNLRVKLLVTGGVFFAVLAACLLLALLQWMHRQTQEKLLRIEYHLAELMERRTG